MTADQLPRNEEAVRRLTNPQNERFWRSYFALGCALLATESAAVVAYLLRTPHGQNRALLLVITVAEVAVGLFGMLAIDWLSRQPWRSRASFIWSSSAVVVLAYCAHLDGGLESPMLYLSVLPVLFASMALTSCAVVGVGAITAGGILSVGITDRVVAIPQESLTMFAAFVVGVTFLSVLAARHREQLQADDHALTRRLAELSVSDALTGCGNQRLFHERLAEEVDRAKRHQRPLSLIVCDVDLFKEFNDLHGHDVGDAALARIGAHLRAQARSSDLVARIGGDEFALLLPETSAREAADLATRVVTLSTAEGALPVSLSLGVAGLDGLEPTVERLFRDADQAMYDAKASGRAHVAHAVPVSLVQP